MSKPIPVAPKKNKAPTLIVVGVILLAIAMVLKHYSLTEYLSLEYIKSKQAILMAYTESNWLLVCALFMGIYIVSSALSMPGALVLTLAGGMLFGVFWGTIIVSFASTTGATCAFLVARFIMRDAVQKRFSKKLKLINDGVEREGSFYLFALRLVPAFPFFLINIVMGLTPLRAFTFFWVSQLGMLPGTIAYVNAGTQISEVEAMRDVLSMDVVLSLAILGVLPLVFKYVIKRFRKQVTQ